VAKLCVAENPVSKVTIPIIPSCSPVVYCD